MGTLKAPRNTHKLPLFIPKIRKKSSNFPVFEIANNFIAGIQCLAHRLATKKIENPHSPAEYPQLPLFASNVQKNSNLAVFEIANNCIAGIQFLAHRLATQKIENPHSPAEDPQTTLNCYQITKKNSNFAVFEITNNFFVDIHFLAHRLATKKLGTLKTPHNTPKLPLLIPKIRKKFLISAFL